MLSSAAHQTVLAISTITTAAFVGITGWETEDYVSPKKEAKPHRHHYPHPRPSSPATTPGEGPYVHHVPLQKRETQQGAFGKAAQHMKEGVEAALPSRKAKPVDLPALVIPGATTTTQMEKEERPTEQPFTKVDEGEQSKLPAIQEGQAQGEKEGEVAEQERAAVVGEKKESGMQLKEREGYGGEHEEGKPVALSPFEEEPFGAMPMPRGPSKEYSASQEIRPSSSSSRLGAFRKRRTPSGGFSGGPPRMDPNTKEVKCSIM